MSWETIRGAGKVCFIKEIPDGPQVRITNDFLDQTIRNFTKLSAKYYDCVGDMAFAYREKQLHSVLFSSIAAVADAAFLEQPTTRKCNESKSERMGWIDYWCFYRNTIFLIEVKHEFNSALNGITREQGRIKWQEAIKQIKNINDPDLICADGYEIVKIALMVTVNFMGSKTQEKFESGELYQSLEESNDHMKSLRKDLNPRPQWSAAWHLHDNLLDPLEVDNNRWEVYPSVNFFAYVEPKLLKKTDMSVG